MNMPPLVPHKCKCNRSTKVRDESKTYGRKHKLIRKLLLSKYPICQICNARFSEVAHHKRYGDDLTIEDYMAICKPCHKEIHDK